MGRGFLYVRGRRWAASDDIRRRRRRGWRRLRRAAVPGRRAPSRRGPPPRRPPSTSSGAAAAGAAAAGAGVVAAAAADAAAAAAAVVVVVAAAAAAAAAAEADASCHQFMFASRERWRSLFRLPFLQYSEPYHSEPFSMEIDGVITRILTHINGTTESFWVQSNFLWKSIATSSFFL